MELPSELREKVDFDVLKTALRLVGDGNPGNNGKYFADVTTEAAHRAAELTLEWAMELVCSYCGEPPDDPEVEYHCESDSGHEFLLITRAEWLRRNGEEER